MADKTNGHDHVIVNYVAVGKKHQYHWLGVMTSTDPGNMGKPIKGWDAARSAEKLFDGLILGFRPLE